MTEASTAAGRYSLMGLTIGQVEKVSQELGLPSSRWDEADTWLVMGLIYATVEGIPVADMKNMSVAELSAAMAGTEDVEDPTQASG